MSQLYLRTLFIFVLSPLPPGGPGGGSVLSFRGWRIFILIVLLELKYSGALCCAIVLPGRNSDLQAGFWPDCDQENAEIGPPAGRRPAG